MFTKVRNRQKISKVLGHLRGKYALFLVIIGFLPLTWFKTGYLLRPEEVGYLGYANLVDKYLYAWSEHSSNGAPASYSNHLLIFPIGLLSKLLNTVGFSPVAVQQIFIVVYFQAILILSYLFIKRLTTNSLVAFYASLFYVFTSYGLSTFFYTSKMLQMILIPFLFLSFYNYLSTEKIRYVYYHFILLFLCMGLFANPANGVITMLVYPICLVYYILSVERVGRLRLLVRIFKFIFPTLPIFAYVFLVYYFSVLAPGLYETIREDNAFAKSFLYTQINSLLQNFRGAWWETQEAYNPWISLFSSRAVIFSSMIITSIIFVGYYSIRERTDVRKYLYWLFLYLLFIFMAKGSSEPLSFIYTTFFRHIPGFFMFRESWAKFSPILIFVATGAFSYSLNSIVHIPNRGKPLRYVLPVLLFVNSLPYLMGGPFNRSNLSSRESIDVKIPRYWNEVMKWSLDNDSSNVLPLPIIYNDQEYYGWYPVGVGNFTGYLPPTMLFSNIIGVRDSGFPVHKRLFKIYNPKLISTLNIDYILDQKDVINTGLKPLYTIQKLADDKVIKETPDFSFGKLDIYKINPNHYLPRLYSPERIWNYIGDVGMVAAAFDLPGVSKDTTSTFAIHRENDIGVNKNEILVPERLKTVRRDFTIWDDGWAWPVQANVDPSEWKYQPVRLKERFTVTTTLDLLKKIDLKLWLAAKRASEINLYNPSDKIEDEILEDYIDSITDVFNDIKQISSESRDNAFWSVVGKTIMYVKRSNQLLQVEGVAESDLKIINEEYNKFILWVEDAANPTCTDYCYEILPKRDSTYDLLLNRTDFREVEPKEISVELFDYVERRKISAEVLNDTWFRIGPLKLKEGKKYKLGLSFPDMPNIGEVSDWQLGDYSIKTNEIRMEPQMSIPHSTLNLNLSDLKGFSQGSFYLSDSLVFHKNIPGWMPDKTYEISFDYYTEKGKLGVAVVEDVLDFKNSILRRENPGITPVNRLLTYRREIESVCDKYRFLLGECKSHYSDKVNSNTHSKGAEAYIYGFGIDKDKFPEILINNFSIREIRNPTLFLTMGEGNTTKSPKLHFTRLSPVKYQVRAAEAEGSFDLIFNQNFNKGWRLYTHNNRCLSSKTIFTTVICKYLPMDIGKSFVQQHYLANGYANAWVIPPGYTTKDLIIEYWPQRYFYLMGFLMFLAIATLLFWPLVSVGKIMIGKFRGTNVT